MNSISVSCYNLLAHFGSTHIHARLSGVGPKTVFLGFGYLRDPNGGSSQIGVKKGENAIINKKDKSNK